MGRQKLFNWKHNCGTRTNMYKLAIREFKTGETFLLQKACDPQSSKLLEQPPKQEWWKQDNLVNLETLLENKLQKCPRTEPATKGLFLLETLRQWLSKSLMVLYFILKLTKDNKLRISQHWKNWTRKTLHKHRPQVGHLCWTLLPARRWVLLCCMLQTIPYTCQDVNSTCTGRSVQAGGSKSTLPSTLCSAVPGLPFWPLMRHLNAWLGTPR